MTSAIFTVCAIAQSAVQIVPDTICPCPKPIKNIPPSPRPWKYVVEQKNQAKGMITGSFNDSIVIEDHTGLILIPEVSDMNQWGRYVPPVSNLKEVKGSFNRYINVKRFPAPISKQKDCNHRQFDDEYWVWLPIAFFLALIFLAFYLISRKQQPSDPAKNQNSPGSNTPSPTANRKPVAPAVDIKDLIEKTAASGSTIVVHSDGSFKVIPPVKKEEKPGDVKKQTDDTSSGHTKEEAKKV